MQFATTPQPHHYWWASLAVTALSFLRKVVKLNDEESQAWDLVVSILQQYS